MATNRSRGKKSKASKAADTHYQQAQAQAEAIAAHAQRKPLLGLLAAKNSEQAHYIRTILNKRITFATGRAGSGKSFIPVMLALEALERKECDRVVLVRPMVACGQDMGAVPGDEGEKYSPWLKPFLEVIRLKIGDTRMRTYFNTGKISAEPLQTMRGSTYRDAFVILDEAQNTTNVQMKMFLTRLGENTRMVINGDDSQIDLPSYMTSGLSEAMDTLMDIQEIGIIELRKSVRDPLIDKILDAYEQKK